jgi:hypothetical protein
MTLLLKSVQPAIINSRRRGPPVPGAPPSRGQQGSALLPRRCSPATRCANAAAVFRPMTFMLKPAQLATSNCCRRRHRPIPGPPPSRGQQGDALLQRQCSPATRCANAAAVFGQRGAQMPLLFPSDDAFAPLSERHQTNYDSRRTRNSTVSVPSVSSRCLEYDHNRFQSLMYSITNLYVISVFSCSIFGADQQQVKPNQDI